MRNAKRFMRTTTAYLAIGLIFTQPILAQVIVDTSAPQSNQATLSTTSNKVPLVNIAAPSTGGLSHNKFEAYSVDELNLILNNSTQTVDTLISGEIQANPNFNGTSAAIILNEVTGVSASTLNGFTEIAGDQAKLIIANPNGISCDGCGFINTPSTTLTTGVPNVLGGQLSSFSVHQGNIQITGDGINTGNVEQLNLISRQLEVDAPLLARELNIITGLNDVTYDNLQVSVRESSDGNAPTLAIDSSSLGGMYANSIALISTEQGLGVTLDGNMATDVGSVTLSANGDIQVKSIVAADLVDIESHTGGVDIQETTYGDTVTINAQNALSNSGTIASLNSTALNSDTFNNTGTIVAGIHPNGNLNPSQQLVITNQSFSNSGAIIATQDVDVSSQSINNSDGSIEAITGNVNFDDASTFENNNGEVIAAQDITLTSTQFNATEAHGLHAGDNLTINTQNFNNTAAFEVDSNINLNLAGQFTNSGEIQTSGNLNVSAANFSNEGTGKILVSGTNEVYSQSTLFNSGIFTAGDNFRLSAENIENKGVLASGNAMTLIASQDITNSNTGLDGIPIALYSTFNGSDVSTNEGGEDGTLIFSVGDLSIQSNTFQNEYADIYSFGNVTIAKDENQTINQAVSNSSGRIEATGNIDIHSQNFTNAIAGVEIFDYSALCENNTHELCTSIDIVGGDLYGVSTGTPLTEAWLFDTVLDLATTNYTEEESYEIALDNLKRLYLAAKYSPQIIAGYNLNITGDTVVNQGGLLSAANDINIDAVDFVNETIVAAAIGPGQDGDEGTVGAFAGPFIGSDVIYYLADGTPDQVEGRYSDEITSILSTYLEPDDDVFGDEAYIFLNAGSFGISDSVDKGLPIAISESGKIIIFNHGPYGYKRLSVDDTNTLFISSDPSKYDEGDAPPPYSTADGMSIEQIVEKNIVYNETTEQFELILGENRYALETGADGLLRVNFDQSSPLMEFEIQSALAEFTTTALGNISYNPFDIPTQSEEVNTTFFSGKIQAGGNVNISASNSFTNGVTAESFSPITPAPAITIPTVDIDSSSNANDTTLELEDPSHIFASLDNAVPSAADFQRVDVDTTIPDTGGLFTASTDDRFLVATNASVSQFIDSYGSDYLLEALNYQPEEYVKRLGDGFYESYLIREAIMSQTGSRFLTSSLRNDQQQMRYLMDNAVAAQESLHLSLGVRLSADQVAALTHDMVWMEEKLINGQRVLVPTLYLAQIRPEDFPINGNIMARNVSINAGAFSNSGSIISRNLINVETTNNLASQGAMIAGDSIQLQSDQDISIAGIVSAGNHVLADANRDINARNGALISAENVVQLSASNDINIDESQITAGDNLIAVADGNINLNRSRLNSGGDILLLADDSIEVTASRMVADQSITLSAENGSTDIRNSLLMANNNLAIASNDDVSVSGTRLSGENVQVNSINGNITNQQSYVVSSENTEFVTEEGSILNEGLNIQSGGSIAQVAGGNITSQSLSGNRTVFDSEGSIILDAGENIDQTGVRLSADETVALLAAGEISNINRNASTQRAEIDAHNLTMSSGQDLINDSNLDIAGSISLSGRNLTNTGSISAGENLSISATEDITNIAADLSAGENMSLNAGRDIIIDATSSSSRTETANGYETELVYTGSNITAGNNMTISAGNNVSIMSSNVDAQGDLAFLANGDINVGAYQNEYYSYYADTDEERFLGFVISTTTTVETNLRTENVASQINAGGNLTLNSVIDENGTILTGNDNGVVNISGSQVHAGQQLVVYGGDVNVVNQVELDNTRTEVEDSGYLFGWIGAGSDHSEDNQQIIAQSRLESTEDLSMLSAGNITIIGSDAVSGNNINVDSQGDLLISAAQSVNTTQTHTTESGLGTLNSLYGQLETSSATLTTTTQSSNLNADGDINLDANRIAVIGSNAQAGNSINATATEGDIRIISIDELHTEQSSREEVTLGISGLASALDVSNLIDRIDEDRQLNITLAEADYNRDSTDTTTTAVVSSNFTANNSINIDAAGNAEIIGSNLSADADQNYSGNIDISAGGDVVIGESYETVESEVANTQGTAELSVSVTHQAVEVARAYENLEAAENQLSTIRENYRQYQNDLEQLEDRLASLQADYDQGVPGVSYAHIQELSHVIDRMQEDDALYESAIALAAVNVVSQSTALTQQLAAASQSAGTYGFDAGLQLAIDGTETTTQSTSQTAVGSTVSGNNINISSGNSANNSASSVNIVGSGLFASGDVDITTDTLNIAASQNEYQSTTETQQTSVNLSMSAASLLSGGPVSTSLSSNASQSEQQATDVNNSTIMANNIRLRTTDDANITGANVNAYSNLDLNIGGDLNLESQQNTSSTESENTSASAGTSIGSGGLNGSFGTGQSTQSSSQTNVTSLTGNQVTINVDNNTHIEGALIAAINAEGEDTGNLSLTTETLSVTHLTDSDEANSQNLGTNSSVNGQGDNLSIGNTGLQFGIGTASDQSVSLATIGNGSITVASDADNNTDSTADLNRDSNNTSLDLYSTDTGTSVDATLDTRLLTEQGRDQIAEDLMRSELILDSIVQSVTADHLTVLDFRSELEQSNNIYDAVKDAIAQDPALAAALQDTELSAELREAMLNQITDAVMAKLDRDTIENHIIVTTELTDEGERIGGFYSTDTGDVYINDLYMNDTEQLVSTAGHEMAHAIGDQENIDIDESYADNVGQNLSNFTNAALDLNGYDDGMATSNNHVGINSAAVQANTAAFNNLDRADGEFSGIAVPVVDPTTFAAYLAAQGYDSAIDVTEVLFNADYNESINSLGLQLETLGEQGLIALLKTAGLDETNATLTTAYVSYRFTGEMPTIAVNPNSQPNTTTLPMADIDNASEQLIPPEVDTSATPYPDDSALVNLINGIGGYEDQSGILGDGIIEGSEISDAAAIAYLMSGGEDGQDEGTSSREIQLVNGYYETEDGLKLSEYYYNKLWSNGRPAPFIQAEEILKSNPVITVDPEGTPGFMRYEANGIEMIFNPTTQEIWHIQPVRRK